MELPRRFGFWTSWFVVIASMVGSGILSNSGAILKITENTSSLLILWALGGLISLAGALTLGELASGFPRVGGDYGYVKEAFGRPWGFVYGWTMVIVGFAAPIALVSYTTASFLFPVIKTLLPVNVTESGFVMFLASVEIVVLTLSHCISHTHSSWIHNTTTLFNLCVLLGFSTWGLITGPTHAEHFSLGKTLAEVPLTGMGTGFVLVMYAYTGWNAAIYLAGEVKSPEKLLPRSLLLGCLAVTALYLFVNLMYALALPPTAPAQFSQSELSRFAEMAIRALLGPKPSQLFSLFISLGAFAALSAYILTGPRIVYAMAKDGLFPAAGGILHRRSDVPVLATLLQGAIALLFLWSGSFESILNYASYGLAVISNLVIAPIFVLRHRKTFRPPFKVPFYPWTPIFFLIINTTALIAGFIDQPRSSFLSCLSILAGFPVFYFLVHRRGDRK